MKIAIAISANFQTHKKQTKKKKQVNILDS